MQQTCPHCEAQLLYDKGSKTGTPTLHCKVCEHRFENTQAAQYEPQCSHIDTRV